jgi:KTSC domain
MEVPMADHMAVPEERHWIPAKSKRFHSLDYVPTANRLYVKFHADKNGEHKIYSYENIFPVVFEELMHAESRGKYFNKIVNNPTDFPFKKLGTEPQIATEQQQGGNNGTTEV